MKPLEHSCIMPTYKNGLKIHGCCGYPGQSLQEDHSGVTGVLPNKFRIPNTFLGSVE